MQHRYLIKVIAWLTRVTLSLALEKAINKADHSDSEIFLSSSFSFQALQCTSTDLNALSSLFA